MRALTPEDLERLVRLAVRVRETPDGRPWCESPWTRLEKSGQHRNSPIHVIEATDAIVCDTDSEEVADYIAALDPSTVLALLADVRSLAEHVNTGAAYRDAADADRAALRAAVCSLTVERDAAQAEASRLDGAAEEAERHEARYHALCAERRDRITFLEGQVEHITLDRDVIAGRRDSAEAQVRSLTADLANAENLLGNLPETLLARGAELVSLQCHLGDARREVRSLTVERDALAESRDLFVERSKNIKFHLENTLAERDALKARWDGRSSLREDTVADSRDAGDLRARISSAREALARLLDCGPQGFDLESLLDTPAEKEALSALRSALDEPSGVE